MFCGICCGVVVVMFRGFWGRGVFCFVAGIGCGVVWFLFWLLPVRMRICVWRGIVFFVIGFVWFLSKLVVVVRCGLVWHPSSCRWVLSSFCAMVC